MDIAAELGVTPPRADMPWADESCAMCGGPFTADTWDARHGTDTDVDDDCCDREGECSKPYLLTDPPPE